MAAVITEGPELGWTSGFVLASAAIAAVALPWFVVRSLAHPEPMLDLHLFRAPNMTAVNLVNIGFTAAGTASWLLYPLFMVQHWHYSLMRAGFALTPFPMTAALVGVIAGRLAERVGTRRIIAYGALLPATGMVWQALFLHDEPHYLIGILPGAFLFNTGWGIVYSPIMALAMRGVAEEQMGQASAMLSRSPRRVAIVPAGRSKASIAMPGMAVTNAATPGLAPSVVACSGINGMIAPKPMDASRVGP